MNSRKKGLSIDEKRSRMMDLFCEKKDFFQLKELEKICQKEKGITSMSVKDVLQSLVDDGMVDTDKIGTSVYFWAFPSKSSQKLKIKEQELLNKCNDIKEKLEQRTKQIQECLIGREEMEERNTTLQQLKEARAMKEQLEAELEEYKTCDPEIMQQMKKETRLALDASNRWTDNVFNCKSWIKKKFYFEDKRINKQFDIPEEMDYLEY